MSSPYPDPADGRNPHSSTNKWRHQESSAFAKYAAQGQARDAQAIGNTGDLANFLNKDRVQPTGEPPAHGNAQPITVAAAHPDRPDGQSDVLYDGPGAAADGKEIVCGPLLNYRRTTTGRWYGSVLVVIKGGGPDVLFQPTLQLRKAAGEPPAPNGELHGATTFESGRLYSDVRNTFWSFDIDVPIEEHENRWEYAVPELRFGSEHKPRVNNFFVPAATESMRIMFHSCNGFSVGTDEDAWSGAALWNDVLRKHEALPFHVMLGGGDQIYNDGIRVHGPLRAWTAVGNPKKRREYLFPEKLRAESDDYYLNNYIRWFNTEPFSTANGQIPQMNIWDDHDVRPLMK